MPRNSSRRLTTTSTTKSVQFDTLEIVEFPFIIGDSPAVSSGCPLALDTRPIHRSTFDVNHYETHRRDRRRHGKKLMISVRRIVRLSLFCLFVCVFALSSSSLSHHQRIPLFHHRTTLFFCCFSLLKRGFSIEEIAEATIQADKARQELSASISGQKWDKVNALSERFGRVLFLRHKAAAAASTTSTTSTTSTMMRVGGASGTKKNTTAAVTA